MKPLFRTAGLALACSLFNFALYGCAADCGPDWYAIGQRDGTLGATPQDEIYARRCGGAVDAARYREGWQEGFGRRPRPTACEACEMNSLHVG